MPGHTPGHVPLWREDHRALIAGGGFIVTTGRDSAYAVAFQRADLHCRPSVSLKMGIIAPLRNLAARLEAERVTIDHGQPTDDTRLASGASMTLPTRSTRLPSRPMVTR
ncbi:MAG TPA: hypothetical protein VF226_12340 [Hyphomicrobiaceae bacterium]